MFAAVVTPNNGNCCDLGITCSNQRICKAGILQLNQYDVIDRPWTGVTINGHINLLV
jgi:hypothetical protein